VTQLMIVSYGEGAPTITKIDDVGPGAVVVAIGTLDGRGEVELCGAGSWFGIAGGLENDSSLGPACQR
jgi:hypothetical protein